MSLPPSSLRAPCLGLAVACVAVAASAQPIVHVGDRGAACVLQPPGPGSQALTLSGPVLAGQTLVVTAGATSAAVVPGVPTDPAANAYATDADFGTAAFMRATIHSSRITTGLAPGQQITLPYNNTSALIHNVCAAASVFTGLQTAGWLDQTGGAGSVGVASTSQAVSTQGSITQPNELLIAAFFTGNAGTFTPGAGLTSLTSVCNAAGGACLFPVYRVTTGALVQTATSTTTNAVAWAAALATYRGVVFPVELDSFRVE
jgi:hypothetical protein